MLLIPRKTPLLLNMLLKGESAVRRFGEWSGRGRHMSAYTRCAHPAMPVRVMYSARTYGLMHNTSVEHISEKLRDKNTQLDTIDPVVQGGFTQVPNFILENPDLSVGAKVIYAMFLRYAWHNNKCFPGQARLAEDIGMSIGRVNQFIKELEAAQLIEITKRGQGKTNFYTIKFRVKPKQKG
jgi:hypothetical protein